MEARFLTFEKEIAFKILIYQNKNRALQQNYGSKMIRIRNKKKIKSLSTKYQNLHLDSEKRTIPQIFNIH